MRKLILLFLAISFLLFAYANPALAAENVHDYSCQTALQKGGGATDDTLFIVAAKPCTTNYISALPRFTDLIVSSLDTLAYQADDTTDDSCLYYIVYCMMPNQPDNPIADTSMSAFVRVDSTALYKRIHTAGVTPSVLIHTPKVFSSPAGLMVGEKGFFILQPDAKCDSCNVQVSFILRQE